jgi:hypothetical protein
MSSSLSAQTQDQVHADIIVEAIKQQEPEVQRTLIELISKASAHSDLTQAEQKPETKTSSPILSNHSKKIDEAKRRAFDQIAKDEDQYVINMKNGVNRLLNKICYGTKLGIKSTDPEVREAYAKAKEAGDLKNMLINSAIALVEIATKEGQRKRGEPYKRKNIITIAEKKISYAPLEVKEGSKEMKNYGVFSTPTLFNGPLESRNYKGKSLSGAEHMKAIGVKSVIATLNEWLADIESTASWAQTFNNNDGHREFRGYSVVINFANTSNISDKPKTGTQIQTPSSTLRVDIPAQTSSTLIPVPVQAAS